MAPRYEMCVGLNKGHKTTKIKNIKYQGDRKTKGIQPSRLKGVSSTNQHNLKRCVCVCQILMKLH